MWVPVFECVVGGDGEREYRVGHELIDEFLEFVRARARPNTVKAYAHDLKVFFAVVAKDPVEVTARDVMAFVSQQRRPRAGAENVVRLVDGSAGLSAATIKRRLAAVSALYGYLVVRGDVGVAVNPVPRGLPTRQNTYPATISSSDLLGRQVRCCRSTPRRSSGRHRTGRWLLSTRRARLRRSVCATPSTGRRGGRYRRADRRQGRSGSAPPPWPV